MNITRQQVRDAIARAERHNPTATELSHGRAVVSEGDLFVLIEAAKCAGYTLASTAPDGARFSARSDAEWALTPFDEHENEDLHRKIVELETEIDELRYRVENPGAELR